MEFIFYILFLNIFWLAYGKTIWLPEEIKSPLTNPNFCSAKSYGDTLLCDPENLLDDSIRDAIVNDFFIKIPSNIPCLCSRECDLFDYKKPLTIGIVIISKINSSMKMCKDHHDRFDCFSERVLRYWNISRCRGNNGLILLAESKIHLYLGADIHKKISTACFRRLHFSVKPFVSMAVNLRILLKDTIKVIRKPCLCTDTCSIRHLKWLTNIVFFMGVIVLVTCIGGMSRRAMLAKFHQRTFSSRQLFGDYIVRRLPYSPRPLEDQNVDNVFFDSPTDVRPPDYSTLGPLPKPPPYGSDNPSGPTKEASVPVTNGTTHHIVSDDPPPPSYDIVFEGSSVSNHGMQEPTLQSGGPSGLRK